MKVILPCAGKSSRFPNMRPKWTLTHPEGDLMVKKAIDGLNVKPKDVIITILREHEEKYKIISGLKENIGSDLEIVVLDKQTKNQPETVHVTLKKTGLKESFLVKDSDNMFSLPHISENFSYVCYSDLQDHEDVNPRNYSYIRLNDQNIIVDIVEKRVISRFFSVGGYFFKDPKDFESSFEKLSKKNMKSELYISHIIQNLIVNGGEVFFGKKIEEYVDWGRFDQWSRYTQKFKTYFIDLDGVLFKSAAQYFSPRWEDTEPIKNNLEAVKRLSENEHVQLFFITSRPESYRKLTETQLKKLGLKYTGLMMGCLHAKRIIVNDFSNTTGYPTCESICVLRDSEDLGKYI